MPLHPVDRRLVPDEVFDQLLDEVVDGSLEPGDSLPGERRLAELLGVSRPAVREALQRLAMAGLVHVRHGGSTTVRDFHTTAGLDLLPRLLVRGGTLVPSVGRSIVHARQAIAPQVAALAATQATPRTSAALGAAVDDVHAAADLLTRQRLTLRFWDVLVDAADSVVFRLLFNSLRAAYEPVLDALAPVMSQEVDDLSGLRALSAAVGTGDPDAARLAAEELLRPTTAALDALLSALEPSSTTPRATPLGRAARRAPGEQ